MTVQQPVCLFAHHAHRVLFLFQRLPSSHAPLEVIDPSQTTRILGPKKLLRRRMAEDADPPEVIEVNRVETYQKVLDRLQKAIMITAENIPGVAHL